MKILEISAFVLILLIFVMGLSPWIGFLLMKYWDWCIKIQKRWELK